MTPEHGILNHEGGRQRNCHNCGYPMQPNDRFCENCGQKYIRQKMTFGRMIYDFLDNSFAFDSKFFQTLIPLVIQPGRLSLEFWHGRQVKYVHPLRVFLFLSFIFFLALGFSGVDVGDDVSLERDERSEKIRLDSTENMLREVLSIVKHETGDTLMVEKVKDSLFNKYKEREIEHLDSSRGHFLVGVGVLFGEKSLKLDAREMYWLGDEAFAKKNRFDTLPFLKRVMLKQILKVNKKPDALAGYLLSKLGLGILVMVPLFAMLLKLLYVRHAQFYYIDHFIFSLHFFALLYLIGSLLILGSTWNIVSDTFAGYTMALVPPFYCFSAMRNAYAQGLRMTLFKFVSLMVLGLFAIIIAAIFFIMLGFVFF